MRKQHMKQLFLALILVTGFAGMAAAQGTRINLYSGYVFDDNHVDSYYDANNYYNGAIRGGYQWGAGLEFMARPTMGVELKYLRQDCVAPMEYYSNGIKNKNFDLGINYILLGGNKYFKGTGGKVEPYGGLGMGMAVISIKNPAPGSDSSKEKFAWNVKLGTNIWLTPKVGIKLQAQLLSAVQSVGGGFFFGTGGSGAAVTANSSMYQFELGGGLVFKMGK